MAAGPLSYAAGPAEPFFDHLALELDAEGSLVFIVASILSACQVDGSPNLECPMGGVQSKVLCLLSTREL